MVSCINGSISYAYVFFRESFGIYQKEMYTFCHIPVRFVEEKQHILMSGKIELVNL